MTEKEKQDVKDIISTTVNSFKNTIMANFKFNDRGQQLIESTAKQEIEWGQDDVDRLNPEYWKDIEKPNTFYVEWNGHHPQ